MEKNIDDWPGIGEAACPICRIVVTVPSHSHTHHATLEEITFTMIDRGFDQKDAVYRQSKSPDMTGREGFTLEAIYDQSNHTYVLQYRGHNLSVDESELMWGQFPMDTLAEKANAFMRSVDKQVGWDWEPKKMNRDDILSALETSRRERD